MIAPPYFDFLTSRAPCRTQSPAYSYESRVYYNSKDALCQEVSEKFLILLTFTFVSVKIYKNVTFHGGRYVKQGY